MAVVMIGRVVRWLVEWVAGRVDGYLGRCSTSRTFLLSSYFFTYEWIAYKSSVYIGSLLLHAVNEGGS